MIKRYFRINSFIINSYLGACKARKGIYEEAQGQGAKLVKNTTRKDGAAKAKNCEKITKSSKKLKNL